MVCVLLLLPLTAVAVAAIVPPLPSTSPLPLVLLNASHPHPPCCKGCPKGPCTACRTPGKGVCCPCLPPTPPLPVCPAPEICPSLSSARGYGASFGMLDELLVFAGGFKGNAGLDAVDIFNTSSKTWSHAKMSTGRTLFAGAALGHIAIFGCGEGDGGGTADIYDARTGKVSTVKLGGGSRKKCAATAVTLAIDSNGTPTEGKILIAGGYKSVAVDVYDLKTGKWTLTKMSESHFYMASASAGPFSLFCGGLAPSGDTALCDIYDARGDGSWTTGNLTRAVREINAATATGTNGEQAAVFIGGGITTVFTSSADGSHTSWSHGNSTAGESPWCKFGAATSGDGGRFAVFAGGNGNAKRIEVFDAVRKTWAFAPHNLSLGREQVMGAGTSEWVGFAGGTIGSYNPTGYTSRVDLFHIEDLFPQH